MILQTEFFSNFVFRMLIAVIGKKITAGQWWCTPLIPALRRQKQVDLCEFKAILVDKS